jgi:hypothetical protein
MSRWPWRTARRRGETAEAERDDQQDVTGKRRKLASRRIGSAQVDAIISHVKEVEPWTAPRPWPGCREVSFEPFTVSRSD